MKGPLSAGSVVCTTVTLFTAPSAVTQTLSMAQPARPAGTTGTAGWPTSRLLATIVTHDQSIDGEGCGRAGPAENGAGFGVDFEPGRTRNIHYTKILTQPWVFAGHPHGRPWVDAVAQMLREEALSAQELREEVELGYLRPSLLLELGLESGGTPINKLDTLQAFDKAAGFVPHRKLQARFIERKRAVARASMEEKVARRPWLGWFYELRYKRRYGKR